MDMKKSIEKQVRSLKKLENDLMIFMVGAAGRAERMSKLEQTENIKLIVDNEKKAAYHAFEAAKHINGFRKTLEANEVD